MIYDYNLFSEIYGCYFSVVSKILDNAQNGISKKDIEKIILDNAFCDTAFLLIPKLFSDEWGLLKQKEDMFYAKISDTVRPLTFLEKSWLKTILQDKRILLFISQEEKTSLDILLNDVEPLFDINDFYAYDVSKYGDPYTDDNYIYKFKTILNACKTNHLKIEYKNEKNITSNIIVLPNKLEYSSRDDKFRLLGVLINKNNRLKPIKLNVARIQKVEQSNMPYNYSFKKIKDNNYILLTIYDKRNALERFMLQFSSWKKETIYDDTSNTYICKIFYDKSDETELLIRILSFGPVLKVLEPESFLTQVKERIKNQNMLLFRHFKN